MLLNRINFYVVTFLFVGFSCIGVNSFAGQPANTIDSKLRYLSLVLKGVQPTLSEYQQVRKDALSGISDDAILSAQAKAYMNSMDFTVKWTNNFADLYRVFQIPILSNRTLNNADDISMSSKKEISTFNLIVAKVFSKNLPWNYLVTAKTFPIYNNGNTDSSAFQSVTEFYEPFLSDNLSSQFIPVENLISSVDLSNTTSSNSQTKLKVFNLEFSLDDNRFAGILTTPTFIQRYVTTGVNKNRRRAAAVFRTMLCKNMVAAIPVSSVGKDDALELANRGDGLTSEQDLFNLAQSTKMHGQNKDCQYCHRQLDPMGQFFGLIGNRMTPWASPGKLVYVNESGKEIKIENLNGIGDMANVLTQQDDYFSCQVRHFWKWTYGDQFLSPIKEKELVQVFKNLNQKPQDFILHLVSQKEFYQPAAYTENQLSTFSAYKTLQKCQGCHNSQDENDDVKGINWFDVISNLKHVDRDYWIDEVAHQLKKNKMPPKDARRDFTEKELENLNRWIKEVKTNFDGVKP